MGAMGFALLAFFAGLVKTIIGASKYFYWSKTSTVVDGTIYELVEREEVTKKGMLASRIIGWNYKYNISFMNSNGVINQTQIVEYVPTNKESKFSIGQTIKIYYNYNKNTSISSFDLMSDLKEGGGLMAGSVIGVFVILFIMAALGAFS